MANEVSKKAQILAFFKSLFGKNRRKVLSIFISAVVFFILFFPYGDLSDYISKKISELSNNQVFLTSEDFGLSLFPAPGGNFKKVALEIILPESSFNGEASFQLPVFRADSLVIRPSLSKLLAFKAGVTGKARGLFNGTVGFSYGWGSKLKKDLYRQDIQMDLSEVNLSEVLKIFTSQVRLSGRLDLDLEASLNPILFQDSQASDSEPHKAQFEGKIRSLLLPDQSIPTPMGPIPIPELHFKETKFIGQFKGQRLFLDEISLGSSKDPLNGKIKGLIQLSRDGGPPSYTIRVENLNVALETDRQLSVVLGLASDYRKMGPSGPTYSFCVRGTETPVFRPLEECKIQAE